jgi:hypothetical protein
MVHNSVGGGDDDVSEATSGQDVLDPLLNVLFHKNTNQWQPTGRINSVRTLTATS